jgi:hypothetical protein
LIVVVAALEVVVTGPPFRFKIVVPAPVDFENVNVCPAVGAMLIAPPVVERVAEEASGDLTSKGFAPPPELTVIAEAPVIDDAVPKINNGVPMRIGPPPPIDKAKLGDKVIEPDDEAARKRVVPGDAFVWLIVPTTLELRVIVASD